MKINDAQKLFFRKEGKVLLGKGYKNAIILIGIFLISLFAIGFGSASMSYLKYKMEDPFINWIDMPVKETAGQTTIKEFINNTDYQEKYKFINPEKNHVLSKNFTSKHIQLQGWSIDTKSSVINKILSDENIITKRDLSIHNSELGIILTEESLSKLGYKTNNIPPFIVLAAPQDSSTCNKLNIKNTRGFSSINIPIFAIVKQLPGNYEFFTTLRFIQEHNATPSGFAITSKSNNKFLNICGNRTDLEKINASINKEIYSTNIASFTKTWNTDINILTITKKKTGDNYIYEYNKLADSIIDKNPNLYRYYNLENRFSNSKNIEDLMDQYYSVQMTSLDSITSFNKELFDECGVNIEMTSIATKENFRVVQRMGTILSWAIIILAAVFICVFINYLLTSHFQKIKPNLGTFKAFGISNKMLTSIYVSALFTITSLSFVVSFVISFILTNIISLFSTIDANFVWIDIMVIENLYLLLIVLLATVFITFWVTKRIFKETPGDLIYNRN